MPRTRSQSVNDIYNPNLFASDSGIHNDIYKSDGFDQTASEGEYSFDPQSESEYSFDQSESEHSFERSVPNESESRTMPPPPAKSTEEMELLKALRELTKETLIKKYIELNATEKRVT